METKPQKKERKPVDTLIIYGLVLLASLILFTIITTFIIDFGKSEALGKIITGIFSLLVVTVPLIIKEYLTSEKEQKGINSLLALNDEDDFPVSGEDTLDIFIYGHSGSGKTTFIKEVFTFSTSPPKSTEVFDYYLFHVSKRLKDVNKNKTIDIKVADYKGQDVNQFIEEARENYFIDALIFMVDVAPGYGENGEKLTIDEVVSLMSDNFEEELTKRVNVHRHKYLSEFLLQVVFKHTSSDFLKSVRLLINKFDVLETLQERGVIDENINLEEYAKELYQETISHIEKFCKVNDIEDFKTVVVSAEKNHQTKKIVTELLDKFTNR